MRDIVVSALTQWRRWMLARQSEAVRKAVQALTPDRLRFRVWERGAGITQACGSGAPLNMSNWSEVRMPSAAVPGLSYSTEGARRTRRWPAL